MAHRGSPKITPSNREGPTTVKEELEARALGEESETDEEQPESPGDPFTDGSGASTPSQSPAKPDPQSTRTLHSAAPRRTPLGPPPSARRGAASYYPHNAVVTPIIEESESSRSRTSYASVLPEDGTVSGRHSVLGDNDTQIGLVTKASMGKRHSPNLTTITSGTRLSLKHTRSPSDPSGPEPTGSATTVSAALDNSVAREPAPQQSLDLSSRASTADPSRPSTASSPRSQSPRWLLDDKPIPSTTFDPRSSPGKAHTRAARDRGEDLDEKSAVGTQAPPNLSDRRGARVPRINVDAGKDAETRGSLASLPELIRRATKLAANLDRNKTASRLGVDAWVNEKLPASSANDSSSLSDVLNAFPRAGGRKALGSDSAMEIARSDSRTSTGRKRRCCGMPMWLAVLVFILLVVIVAVAIIVPVVVIVVPRQDPDSPPPSTPEALVACQQSLPCANGGLSILSTNGSCQCICVNGYTGDQCVASSGVGCITANFTHVQNATMGSYIPRLLDDAQTNYSIPLNASAILSLFASQNLTCSSENALVTFTGLSARSVDIAEAVLFSVPEHPARSPTPAILTFETSLVQKPTGIVIGRQVSTSTSLSTFAAVTSNGILFAAGSPTSTTSTHTATSSTTSSTPSPSTSVSPSRAAADFARITVLYILQQSMQFDTAATAQQYLQDYFVSVGTTASDGHDQRNVTLGAGWEAVFPAFQIRLNGQVVAGAT